MKPTAARAASDPFDPNLMPASEGDQSLDVPGMLASRIGELYAAEERISRKERAHRLMRQAAEPLPE